MESCSEKNRDIIQKDAYRSAAQMFSSKESVKAFQRNLEILLVTFFALNPAFEYFQGFNDIMTVVFFAFQTNEETLYFVQKLTDRHFKTLLNPPSFTSNLMGNLVIIENIVRQELSITEGAEMIRVLIYSGLISQSKQLVPDLVFPRLDQQSRRASNIRFLEFSSRKERSLHQRTGRRGKVSRL